MPRIQLLKVADAAKHMGVTRGRVYQMIRAGEIKVHRVPAEGRHPERLYITKREADKHTREAVAEARAAAREADARLRKEFRAAQRQAREAEAEARAERWVQTQLDRGGWE